MSVCARVYLDGLFMYCLLMDVCRGSHTESDQTAAGRSASWP